MTTMTVAAGRVRVPQDVREAVERHSPVTVTDRDKSAYVILHPEDFALVSPLLEKRRRGQPIPIERLLTAEDLEILSMDDDDDAAGAGILESWAE
jgi:PHD/YefM family antitoxin component YafN of YafNO toxin-antitoxin module